MHITLTTDPGQRSGWKKNELESVTSFCNFQPAQRNNSRVSGNHHVLLKPQDLSHYMFLCPLWWPVEVLVKIQEKCKLHRDIQNIWHCDFKKRTPVRLKSQTGNLEAWGICCWSCRLMLLEYDLWEPISPGCLLYNHEAQLCVALNAFYMMCRHNKSNTCTI